MKTELPLVSVIVPAYNAEAFIDGTLKSVLSQTYKNIEVLVVDDGSQDRTVEIVESFAQKDSRVILLKQENAGVAAARNLAIEKSKGEYIAPIDADDIWYPQKLEKQVQCMLKADLSVGLVYAWSVLLNEEDTIIGYNPYYQLNFQRVEGDVYPAMLYINIPGNGSVPLIRRACFDKVGGYNSKLKEQNGQGCEDWDIYLRIAEHYQFRVVPEFLIGYRQLSGSMSRDYRSMEKSYSLFMADARKRCQKIPTYVYNWSAAYFYIYLLWNSKACGDYGITLVWLYKAIKLDYALLCKSGCYRCFLECLFNIAVQSVTSLIFPDNHSLLPLQKKLKSTKNVTVNQVITVEDIQKEIHKPQKLPWQPYERIKWYRWLRVLQLCQTVSR